MWRTTWELEIPKKIPHHTLKSSAERELKLVFNTNYKIHIRRHYQLKRVFSTIFV